MSEDTVHLVDTTPGPVDPADALERYLRGLCPLPNEASDNDVDWCLNLPPAGAPVARLRVPRRLRRIARQHPYDLRVDTAFEQVVEACATQPRPHGWLTPPVQRISMALHRIGYAHSVECWYNDRLVGGLYGLAIGALFIGESIFHARDHAGSLALVDLMARLRAGGFSYLDIQMPTTHMARYGAGASDLRSWRRRRAQAEDGRADFYALDEDPEAGLADLLAASAGTSPAPQIGCVS